MAEGTLDLTPEDHALRAALLPRGINVVSSETYGSAMRAKISGDGIEDGKAYQLVITEGPLMRVIELVKNPGQDV